MAERDPRSIRMSDEEVARVDEFAERNDLDDRSEALRKLVKIGLRESRSPLLYRFKDQIVDWVGLLGVTAVIVLLAGFTTPVIGAPGAAKFAIALAVTAALLLAMLEVLRVANGTNQIGERLREIASGVERA